jgi:hypothetical protein
MPLYGNVIPLCRPLTPPLNLLSTPFHVASVLLILANRLRDSVFRRRSIVAEPPPTFTFPAAWVQRQSVEQLVDVATEFMQENSSDVVREDKFKHECVLCLRKLELWPLASRTFLT